MDVRFADPCLPANLAKGSDTVELVAAKEGEKDKRSQHRQRQRRANDALNFDFLPFVIETSGALGPDARKLWNEVRNTYAKRKLPNYIVQEKEHTWSAFTFEQYYLQKFSFSAAHHTARAILGAVESARERAMPVGLRGG